MSSEGTRSRSILEKRVHEVGWGPQGSGDKNVYRILPVGSQLTVSESHRKSRKDGTYRSGGPFYTSTVRERITPAHISDAYSPSRSQYYTGPVYSAPPSRSDMERIGYKNIDRKFGDKNESQLLVDGTNAISYDNPFNPASNLGTSLAETLRGDIPSIPGIQLWKGKVKALKALGGEYLNYQFGWAPLKDEVSSVVNAARHHRDLMKQYHKGEGSDSHRRFDYPLQRSVISSDPQQFFYPQIPGGGEVVGGPAGENSWRRVSLVKETKKWFEGCYTYALPSDTDSWKKALGFGSQADQLYGLSLSPDVLWELTPWSWAVDWFSNAGEVVNNVTNFGLAGLVLRYGYIMCESIETIKVEQWGTSYLSGPGSGKPYIQPGASTSEVETITKVRFPASPFGFGIGWEGLSPTQLAITAALGITRAL